MPLPQNMDLTDLCRFRTKKCQRKSTQGHCELDVKCPFSHCLSWHRRNPIDFDYSQHLCPDVDFRKEAGRMRVRNRCSNGRSCKFAHTKEEQMYHPYVYKTQLCRDHPNCEKAYCPFAHDLDDMRRSPRVEEEMRVLRQHRSLESLEGALYDSPPTRSPPGIDFHRSPSSMEGNRQIIASMSPPKLFAPNPSPRSCSMSTTSSRTNESPRTLSVLSPACHALPTWSSFSEETRLCCPLPETVPEETPNQLLESDVGESAMFKETIPLLFDLLLNYYRQQEGQNQSFPGRSNVAESSKIPISDEITNGSEALLNSIKDLRSALPGSSSKESNAA